MKTAREWKAFYARERDALGGAGLRACLEQAADVELPERGALVFPHTRLATSGELAAAVARAVVRSGREEVLALGVLHGAREEDAELVQRARAGTGVAIGALRRVHGPGVAGDGGHWREEFSLDGFCALVELAARVEGRRVPRVVCRYPFLVGERPETLPGIEELTVLVAGGAALVGTTDPVHHGAGYGTAAGERLARESEEARRFAREVLQRQGELLGREEYGEFLRVGREVGSDFRDVGPVLAHLLRARMGGRGEVRAEVAGEVRLVDYADVLEVEEPTWVAGAVVQFGCGAAK